MSQTKYLLNESDLPKTWYNINADMPVPLNPVLHPGTKEPVTPEFLSVLFPMELIMQEVSTERYIDIPEDGPEAEARFFGERVNEDGIVPANEMEQEGNETAFRRHCFEHDNYCNQALKYLWDTHLILPFRGILKQ